MLPRPVAGRCLLTLNVISATQGGRGTSEVVELSVAAERGPQLSRVKASSLSVLAPSNASNAVGCKPEFNHFARLLFSFFFPRRVFALSLRRSSCCQEGGDQKQDPGHRKDGSRLLGAQVRHISAIVWLHFTAGIIFRSKGCYGEVHEEFANYANNRTVYSGLKSSSCCCKARSSILLYKRIFHTLMRVCVWQRGERERPAAEGPDPNRHSARGSSVRRTAHPAER